MTIDGQPGHGPAAFHVLSSNRLDATLTPELVAADQKPRHHLHQLAATLDAPLRQPGDAAPGAVDRLLALAIAQPENWALARQALRSAAPGDVVYCNGEHAGIPVALLNAVLRRRARVVVSIMAPHRPRPRVLLKLLALVRHLPLFVTGTDWKAEYLRSTVKADEDSVVMLGEQVDERFFRPPETSTPRDAAVRARPLVAGSGLEQRDYETLAAAVRGLDVDVRVCAVSPNYSKRTTVRMPQALPPNMEMKHLELADLRQLYQSADVTVVSLLENDYAAGSTALLEAIACGSPVVLTEVPGFEELIELGLVIGVPPAEPEALRAAIEKIIDDPAAADARAIAALEYFRTHHASSVYLERLVRLLRRHGERPV